MRPGQLTPNELESAILQRIAAAEPGLRAALGGLHVLSREYTGVGSFTNFVCDASPEGKPAGQPEVDRAVSPDDLLIRVPGVSVGLGAILFCRGNQPTCLEIFRYADGHWDGTYAGFSLEDDKSSEI